MWQRGGWSCRRVARTSVAVECWHRRRRRSHRSSTVRAAPYRIYRLARTALRCLTSTASRSCGVARATARSQPVAVSLHFARDCSVCEAICPCLVPLDTHLTLFCCSCAVTESRPVRRDAALLFPSCTRINVSNVRRLSQSTVVVVVHGRRPPPSPLTEATALDTLPENDQAHSSAVQLITPFDNPTSFSDVAATTDSSSSSSSTT